MPSKSEKQARLMRAAAHNKEFADRVGIDQKTAQEWVEADQKEQEKTHSNESQPPYLDW